MKKWEKRIACWLLLSALVLVSLGEMGLKAEAVTPSKETYSVWIRGGDVFLCNDKTIGSEIGTEYYMTYTVKKADKIPKQEGLLGTEDNKLSYPYIDKGLLRYNESNNLLLVEGATYYIKFTIASGGYEYNVTRVMDDQVEDLYMETVYSYDSDGVKDMLDNFKYFGVWFATGNTEAELTDVRCYDADGNDLGVWGKSSKCVILKGELSKNTGLEHWYDVVVSNGSNIGISQGALSKTSKVFMEYKVASAEGAFTQEGTYVSNSPEAGFPHATGALRYFDFSKNAGTELLDVGAEYIICFERAEDGFSVLYKKTKNGVSEEKLFPILYISDQNGYKAEAKFFGLWFGEKGTASFKLENFKCYDENGNNLGVQTNQKNVVITHHGSLEDYSYCEATYYCKENGRFLNLYEDQSLKFAEGDTILGKGTYSILERDMTTRVDSKTRKYDFMYAWITDDEGQIYRRLYNYNLRFVTGTDEKVETQYFSNEAGYRAVCPEGPVLKGYEFEGWCLDDGSAYDFDEVVTESAIVYAKYSGDGGIVYLANKDIPETDNAGHSVSVVAIAIGAGLLLTGAVVCVLLIMKRNKKNDVVEE